MNTLRYIAVLLLLQCTTIGAQEIESKEGSKKLDIKSDFQVGMVIGGQVSNEQFIYKSGPSFQYSINTRISNWLDAGVGLGVQLLETEVILPIFIDFKGKLKSSGRSPLLGVNIGSSNGWSTYYRNFSDYEYSGGYYFSPYYAMQFPIAEKANFLVAFGYVHQLGYVEFFTDYNERYIESFAIDFLTFRAGIRF